MLKKHIIQNELLIIILLLSLVFCFFAIQEINKPINYTCETFIPRVHTKETKLLIFGDMMLDRGVRQMINEYGAEYPFELIKDQLSNNDIVVANAEGPFTNFNSRTLGIKNAPLSFTFDSSDLKILKNLGFTLLGQANNHTLNFGIKGFNQSTTSITLAGLDYFGDPLNQNVLSYIKEINNKKIGFIAYNEFSYQGKDRVISKIKELSNLVSYLIVYPHWGEEYNQKFTQAQQKMAHEFIDAGADVVIGTHPHVVEPIEIYKDKPIFYSIGNFIFDQFREKPTTEGLALQIILSEDDAVYKLNPFFINHSQASFMDAVSRQVFLNNLATSSLVSDDYMESIATGTIKILR